MTWRWVLKHNPECPVAIHGAQDRSEEKKRGVASTKTPTGDGQPQSEQTQQDSNLPKAQASGIAVPKTPTGEGQQSGARADGGKSEDELISAGMKSSSFVEQLVEPEKPFEYLGPRERLIVMHENAITEETLASHAKPGESLDVLKEFFKNA